MKKIFKPQFPIFTLYNLQPYLNIIKLRFAQYRLFLHLKLCFKIIQYRKYSSTRIYQFFLNDVVEVLHRFESASIYTILRKCTTTMRKANSYSIALKILFLHQAK